MSVQIKYHGGQFVPDLVLGVEWSREAKSIVHELVDGTDVAVTLRPAGKRSGTLELFFLTEADALEAERVLAMATTLNLADTLHTGRNMRFVVTGNITPKLDPDTRRRWTVKAGYREV